MNLAEGLSSHRSTTDTSEPTLRPGVAQLSPEALPPLPSAKAIYSLALMQTSALPDQVAPIHPNTPTARPNDTLQFPDASRVIFEGQSGRAVVWINPRNDRLQLKKKSGRVIPGYKLPDSTIAILRKRYKIPRDKPISMIGGQIRVRDKGTWIPIGQYKKG